MVLWDKDANATCYMNSVLQMQFILEGYQRDILVEGACKDPNEDFSIKDWLEDESPEDDGERLQCEVLSVKHHVRIYI